MSWVSTLPGSSFDTPDSSESLARLGGEQADPFMNSCGTSGAQSRYQESSKSRSRSRSSSLQSQSKTKRIWKESAFGFQAARPGTAAAVKHAQKVRENIRGRTRTRSASRRRSLSGGDDDKESNVGSQGHSVSGDTDGRSQSRLRDLASIWPEVNTEVEFDKSPLALGGDIFRNSAESADTPQISPWSSFLAGGYFEYTTSDDPRIIQFN